MAYDFNGSSDNLELASALVSGVPLSLFARFTTDTTAAGNASIVSIAASTGTNAFQMRRSGNRIEAVAASGATVGNAVSLPVTAGADYAMTAVFASATSRAVYDGSGSSATDTTNVTPTGLNRTNIGARYNAGALSAFWDGRVSEVGIWSVALTADEAQGLFAGASPLLVRPQGLVAYFPLIRGANDMKAAQGFTINGATVAPHHKVRYPPRRQ